VMQSPMQQQTPYGSGPPPQMYPQQRGSLSGGQAPGQYGVPPPGQGMPPSGQNMPPGQGPPQSQRPGTAPSVPKPEPPKSKYREYFDFTFPIANFSSVRHQLQCAS
jgi:hypothetical protein